MTCPICKTPVPLDGPEMPFCSERCRLIDLGMWSAEEYRIPTTEKPPSATSPEEAERNE